MTRNEHQELQAEIRKRSRELIRELFWQVALTVLTFCLLVVAVLQLMPQ